MPVDIEYSVIALNRKNALFAGHDEGGRAWGRIASLIETAKMNGIAPFAYLKANLDEAVAGGYPASKIGGPPPGPSAHGQADPPRPVRTAYDI